MQPVIDNEQSSQPTAHEHLIQMLSTILLQLNSLQTLLHPPQGPDKSGPYASGLQPPDLDALRDGLTTIEEITRDAIYEVRSADDDNLLLTDLVGITLAEALSRAVEETAESLGLSSRVAFNGEERPLPSYTERLLYRIAQEAFYQVQQHSNARRLRFAFSYGRDEVQMSIEDDGILPALARAETPIPHFQNDGGESDTGEAVPLPYFEEGRTYSEHEERNSLRPYAALRHRIEHLGGSLEVSTQVEQWTRVLARVPYTTPVGARFIAPNGSRGRDAGGRKGSQAQEGAIKRTPTDDSRNMKVRVLVVDNQAISRAGLRRVLESYPDLQVIGEAADGVQAVSETLELGPQVVLMDAHLPNGQSIEALKQIKQLNLDTRVLLFSAQDREEYLYETLRAGADGYVLKDIVPDELAQAVRIVASGEVLVQPRLAGRLLSRFGPQGRDKAGSYALLTAREKDVLRLLARGLRNKEIAARLIVSERTVNFHLANIYQKLNVSGRTEALSKALEQGLITA